MQRFITDRNINNVAKYFFKFGLEMEGLQTLVKNILGPKSVVKDLLRGRLSLKDILEPIQHPSPSMLLHIRSIMDKVGDKNHVFQIS